MKYRARKTLNGFLNSRARTLRGVNLKIEILAKRFSTSLYDVKFTYICNLRILHNLSCALYHYANTMYAPQNLHIQ